MRVTNAAALRHPDEKGPKFMGASKNRYSRKIPHAGAPPQSSSPTSQDWAIPNKQVVLSIRRKPLRDAPRYQTTDVQRRASIGESSSVIARDAIQAQRQANHVTWLFTRSPSKCLGSVPVSNSLSGPSRLLNFCSGLSWPLGSIPALNFCSGLSWPLGSILAFKFLFRSILAPRSRHLLFTTHRSRAVKSPGSRGTGYT
ncbi:hypothetical protein CRG98_028127 [Punica granatum]|uniref:Uncharacterized protein n=1 Tax=Punica granatum TaxID=22663 RepID=A0A2I0J6D4_PUNGR|nr:hypothetical protein CRG98_028127 [Punica granatum]